MSLLEQIDHSAVLLTLEKHLTIDNVIVITDQANVINPPFFGKGSFKKNSFCSHFSPIHVKLNETILMEYLQHYQNAL